MSHGKINAEDTRAIVDLYSSRSMSMIDLAERFSVSRMAIHKLLVRNGVDTTRAATPKPKGYNYKLHLASSRLARVIVSEYVILCRGNTVHHKDGDQTNNSLRNLSVFDTVSDHRRYHWGHKVLPLWDGAKVRQGKTKL